MKYKCPNCGKLLEFTSEELLALHNKVECHHCNTFLEIVGEYAYMPLADGSLDLAGDDAQEEAVQMDKPQRDPLYNQAVDYIITCNAITPTMLSEYFSIPIERAQALIDQLEADGVVGPYNGGAPRKILIPHNTDLPFGFQQYFDSEAPQTPPPFKQSKVYTINCGSCLFALLILLALIAMIKLF